MRKLRRSVARFNMSKRGIDHINRPSGKDHRSYFAKHWREYSDGYNDRTKDI